MAPPLTYTTIAAIDVANSGRMRAGLARLERRNLASKRGRAAREHKARMAAEQRRTAPNVLGEPVRTPEVPVTFKAEPKRRRVERPATSTAPKSTVPAERVHTPVKAASLPDQVKAATREHKMAGHLSGAWFRVAIIKDTEYFARLHGASVRYSTAA
ncbi:hypothetical protein [Streptomyces malaysiensis]|uniref:Uncharacterized protein n=1 Tax=Streptomyces malaysiensis TaxID=92644 RepID=A0A7X5X7J1_STRMQ|nr:hypothetical protein [Streptomyces malaysiensis]NIY68086.1 hypothetical protein [Streptomyces malaysiensis]